MKKNSVQILSIMIFDLEAGITNNSNPRFIKHQGLG